MATLNEGALSPPMPKLHMENFDPGCKNYRLKLYSNLDPSLDKSTSIEGSENDSFEQLETPPINEEYVTLTNSLKFNFSLITANILLFQQLKQQQERQEKEKKDKVRQKEERLRKVILLYFLNISGLEGRRKGKEERGCSKREGEKARGKSYEKIC